MKVTKTKKCLIREIAEQSNKTVADTKDFYNAFETIIFNSLSSVNEKQDICIKLFEGINLNGTYISEKKKKNNLTNQIDLVESKIKPKFNITRSYCEKLNKK